MEKIDNPEEKRLMDMQLAIASLILQVEELRDKIKDMEIKNASTKR